MWAQACSAGEAAAWAEACSAGAWLRDVQQRGQGERQGGEANQWEGVRQPWGALAAATSIREVSYPHRMGRLYGSRSSAPFALKVSILCAGLFPSSSSVTTDSIEMPHPKCPQSTVDPPPAGVCIPRPPARV